jgi:hypothetical protein
MSSNFSCPSVYDLAACVITESYLRPGPGNTFMPWLFALMFLLLHVALLWGRVTRWEKSQYISLAMAAFTIFLTSLAFASSKLTADTVYVWLPWTLSSEVGAILQAHGLIYQRHGERIKEWKFVSKSLGAFNAMIKVCSCLMPFGPRLQRQGDLETQEHSSEVGGDNNHDVKMPGTI